jgi:hypothetical protein
VSWGKLRQRAIEEKLRREALGLPPPRRSRRLGPRLPGADGQPAPRGRHLAFSECQHCGALRIPDASSGKLPPHRCGA